MSFLAPLFLLGGLAIGLPVIFHLIRRTTRERTIFSSLMFLLPTPPRLTRRSRLENILLLLVRCAVLVLLALGFARPFFARPIAENNARGAVKRMLVLLDTSASMRRANLWSDACARTESILGQAGPADEVAVFTFDRQLQPLVTFEQWQTTPIALRAALATSRLKALSPGWAGTHLGNALIGAAEALADTTAKSASTGPRQLVLISDLQEGSHLDQLQGYEWPKGVELLVEPLKPRHPSNAGLQLAAESDETETNKTGNIRVRVTNSPGSQRDQFKLGWSRDGRGVVGKPTEAYVPAGQARIIPVPAPENQAGLDRIILQGDDEDFDNTVYVLPPEANRSTVLYLGTETEKDSRQPLYFLERAFQETRREAVQVLARSPAAAFPASELKDAALVMVTDLLPETLAGALHQEVTSGKTLLVAPKSDAIAPTLARLLGVEQVRVSEGRPAGYAMFTDIDLRHPLFAPFADPRFSDFTKIHFWKYRRIDATTIPGARRLADFDTGDPALLEVGVGRGRILVLASGWHPEDSQLALSTKFVPLLYSLLEQSRSVEAAPAQYEIGDRVSLATGAEVKGQLSVKLPDGSELKLAAGETNFSHTMMPGVYSLALSQPPRRFAVNLDAAESRTAPLPLDELERLGAPVLNRTQTPAREAERKLRLQNAELENRQKLWRWFLVATLAALLTETWLAGRTTRRQTLQAQPIT